MTIKSPVLEQKSHDHGACTAAALRHAEQVCLQKRVRFTPQRRRVLRALLESHVPASAYDVIERLGRDGPKPAPVSVYRTLDFLVANNLAHRIESRKAYLACDRGADCTPGAILFLVCDVCGAAGEAESVELGHLVSEESDRHGFMPWHRVLEVRGQCAQCA